MSTKFSFNRFHQPSKLGETWGSAVVVSMRFQIQDLGQYSFKLFKTMMKTNFSFFLEGITSNFLVNLIEGSQCRNKTQQALKQQLKSFIKKKLLVVITFWSPL